MVTPFYKPLADLAETDRRITILTVQREELVKKRSLQQSRLKQERDRLAVISAKYQSATTLQQSEETRLRTEEQHIIDRRKQLSSFGGAKSAKFLEREIDVAARSVQTLEENVFKALQELDDLTRVRDDQAAALEKFESEVATDTTATDSMLTKIAAELETLQAQRPERASRVDPTMLRLYDRVRTRYPAEPLAIADNGSCKSCFRSLPVQLFNQVTNGSALLQCPGCSRILAAEVPTPIE